MKKFERQTLTDRAYSEIKKGLIAGKFRPGQLMAIRTLAESYGISATPVREALQRLVAEKLLTQQLNRTTIVPVISSAEFTQLYDIRCVLEGFAAEQAARTITPGSVATLRGILGDIDEAIRLRDRRAYLAHNQKFHFLIYECSGAPLLLGMIRELWIRVGPLFNALLDDKGYVARGNDQHRKIVKALAARDSAAARRMLIADISVAAKSLKPRLQDFFAGIEIPKGRGRPPLHRGVAKESPKHRYGSRRQPQGTPSLREI